MNRLDPLLFEAYERAWEALDRFEALAWTRPASPAEHAAWRERVAAAEAEWLASVAEARALEERLCATQPALAP